MRIIKAVKIPERHVDQEIAVVCDICSARSDNEFADKQWEVCEIDISYRCGFQYPDSGYGKTVTVDLCPACFMDKLIPWIKSKGGTPTEKEWEN